MNALVSNLREPANLLPLRAYRSGLGILAAFAHKLIDHRLRRERERVDMRFVARRCPARHPRNRSAASGARDSFTASCSKGIPASFRNGSEPRSNVPSPSTIPSTPIGKKTFRFHWASCCFQRSSARAASSYKADRIWETLRLDSCYLLDRY
jgi:hypothetical protein